MQWGGDHLSTRSRHHPPWSSRCRRIFRDQRIPDHRTPDTRKGLEQLHPTVRILDAVGSPSPAVSCARCGGVGLRGAGGRRFPNQVRPIVGFRNAIAIVSVQAPHGWTDGHNDTFTRSARHDHSVELGIWRRAIASRDRQSWSPVMARAPDPTWRGEGSTSSQWIRLPPPGAVRSLTAGSRRSVVPLSISLKTDALRHP